MHSNKVPSRNAAVFLHLGIILLNCHFLTLYHNHSHVFFTVNAESSSGSTTSSSSSSSSSAADVINSYIDGLNGQENADEVMPIPIDGMECSNTLEGEKRELVENNKKSSSCLVSDKTQTSTTMENEQRGNEKQWKWIPENEHPCNIKRITIKELYKRFGTLGLPPLYKEPLVIVYPFNNSTSSSTPRLLHQRNSMFRNITSSKNILHQFPSDFTVTLTSSNSKSEHLKTMSLKDYVHDMIDTSNEVLPTALSNETYYLFGQTHSKKWDTNLLQYYELPPCLACFREGDDKEALLMLQLIESEKKKKNNNDDRPNMLTGVALSFGIGNRGSGVSWHTHGPGFSETIHGRKHWVLYPANMVPPNHHKDRTSRNWMEDVYTNLSSSTSSSSFFNNFGGGEKNGNNKNPLHTNNHNKDKQNLYQCTIKANELLYFPDQWYHATINLDPYTVFVSTFTSEYQYA